jgi:hypothetical protein
LMSVAIVEELELIWVCCGNLYLEDLKDELNTCCELLAHSDANLNGEHLPWMEWRIFNVNRAAT